MAALHRCVILASLITSLLILSVTSEKAEETDTAYVTISVVDDDLHSRHARQVESSDSSDDDDKKAKWKNKWADFIDSFKKQKKAKGGGFDKKSKKVKMDVKKVDGTSMKMTMGKMKTIKSTNKMYKMSGGQIVEDVSPANPMSFSLFKDVSNGTDSVFLMACDADQCSLSSVIYAGTETYVVEPADANPFGDKGKAKVIKGTQVMPDERTMGVGSDGQPLGIPVNARKRRDLALDQKMKKSLLKRKRRQLNSVDNVVELLILADYSEYMYWYIRAGNNSAAAKSAMELYFILMINMMDLRFENLYEQTGTLDIKFMINAIIYAETEADSPYITDNTFVNANGTIAVDVDHALDDFTMWTYEQRTYLPPHDHLMSVTKRNMAKQSGSDWTYSIIGLAWTGSMCNPSYSLSIIEDPGIGLIDYAAAHEIGHSLMAMHDGSSGCSDGDFNLMGEWAPNGYLPDGSSPFKFSSCSISAIQTFVAGLQTNCMQSSTFDQALFDQWKAFSAPGVFLPIDTQCELMYGVGSRRCFPLTPEICSAGSYCWNPQDPGQCYTMYVRDGSVCGVNMRCVKGNCTDSSIYVPTCPPTTPGLVNPVTVIVPAGITVVPQQIVTTVSPYQSTSQSILDSYQATAISEDQLFC